MKLNKYLSIAFAAGLLFLGACSDDEVSYPEGQGIVLETPRTLDLGGSYASFATQFHMKSDAHYTKAGYVISEKPNPTI